jgi:hypothetical protein
LIRIQHSWKPQYFENLELQKKFFHFGGGGGAKLQLEENYHAFWSELQGNTQNVAEEWEIIEKIVANDKYWFLKWQSANPVVT